MSDNAEATNAALVTLVTSVKEQITALATAQERHRTEVREDIAGIRRDSVLRTEYDGRIAGLETEIANVKRDLAAERSERLADARSHSVSWSTIALFIVALLSLCVAAAQLVPHLH